MSAGTRAAWFWVLAVGQCLLGCVLTGVHVVALYYSVEDWPMRAVGIAMGLLQFALVTLRVLQRKRRERYMTSNPNVNFTGLPSFAQSGSAMTGAPLPTQALPAAPIHDRTDVLGGWRSYSIAPGYPPMLRGSRVPWFGGTLHAECAHGMPIGECLARSGDRNECGIYVLKRPDVHSSNIAGSQMVSVGNGQSVPYSVAVQMGYASPQNAQHVGLVLARVVCGGVVQVCTEGYRAETVRIEELFYVCGDAELGDAGGVSPSEAERIAGALEARYAASVLITTAKYIEQSFIAEEKQQWATLAHTSRQSESHYLSEPRDSSLNPRLSAELSQLLSASENQSP